MELKTYQQQSLDILATYLKDAAQNGAADAFTSHAHPDAKTGLVPEYRTLRNSENVEVAALAAVPYIAIRIPTGGGKTLMGAHFIRCAAENYLDRDRPLVVWLVPSRTIKRQTLDAFKSPRHPYRRELDDAFQGKVSVFDSDDIAQMTPQELASRMCIVVATMATARVENTEIRQFYAHKEDLEPHFISLPKELPPLEMQEDGKRPKFSFANLLRLYRPLVITDEAHNATSDLSVEVYDRLSPSAIIELTATPDMASSNVLVRVSASQLFAEEMIKLPVVLEEHLDGWDVALRHALLRRQELEEKAKEEHPDYIRPILLIQAEHKGGEATVETIYEQLTGEDGEHIDRDWIKIATGDQRELDDIDLFATDCPVRIIITMEALKEGWDCSFAYVLCATAPTKSATAIEQLLGRVLRMPYARKRHVEALNRAYAHVVSPYFGAKAVEFTDHLEGMGFSRIEAAQAVPRQAELVDKDAKHPALKPEVVKFTVNKMPDLTNVPAGDHTKVEVKPAEEEGKFEVTVTGAIQNETVEAIAKTVPKAQGEKIKKSLDQHNVRARLRETPAQKGVVFEIPQLAFKIGNSVVELENDMLVEDGTWNPVPVAGALDTLTFDTHTQTWEIGLGADTVKYKQIIEPEQKYLSGLVGDWEDQDLIVWLDQKVRQQDVKQEDMVTWIAQAIAPLQHKGFNLGQLVRGRFIIARRLLELLAKARVKREGQAFQQVFTMPEVVVDPGRVFRFEQLAYPMRWPCPAPVEWQKHYYAVPGDLPYRRKDGELAEEYQCAQAIERNKDIDVWVRNLVHPTQFKFPTSDGNTYPDFISKLKDGRIFVLEYKGEHLWIEPKEKAKRAIGELWARKNPNGIYLMVRIKDEQGRSMDEQIADAIAEKK